MSDYLILDQLTKTYPAPKGPAIIVENFNLHIKKGEFVTLIGHSGCGKSTVLSMVAGLSSITGGGIILAGKELVVALVKGRSELEEVARILLANGIPLGFEIAGIVVHPLDLLGLVLFQPPSQLGG